MHAKGAEVESFCALSIWRYLVGFFRGTAHYQKYIKNTKI